jgi:hypothetical protein
LWFAAATDIALWVMSAIVGFPLRMLCAALVASRLACTSHLCFSHPALSCVKIAPFRATSSSLFPMLLVVHPGLLTPACILTTFFLCLSNSPCLYGSFCNLDGGGSVFL